MMEEIRQRKSHDERERKLTTQHRNQNIYIDQLSKILLCTKKSTINQESIILICFSRIQFHFEHWNTFAINDTTDGDGKRYK